jgi:hypothetical protein
MMRRPTRHVPVLLIVAILIAALPSMVAAYSGTCHKKITDEAHNIFCYPELEEYLETVGEGAKCEDNIDHIYNSENVCGHTVRHFWDADDSDNFQQNNCLGFDYNNAWVKGRRLVDRACQLYWSYVNTENYSDLDSAYHYLGHACHLIGDMGVPAHVHIDYHPNDPLDDDCYEDWMGQHDCEPCSAMCLLWEHTDALAMWGEFDVGDTQASSINSYLGVECWEPWQVQGAFYWIMYRNNQISDYFASDSYDGDTDDRLGLVSFSGFPSAPTVSDHLDDNDDDPDNDAHGHLSTIANYCFTRSMSATAAFYKVWRDYWDDEDPTTTTDINGAEEVHEGWRPGDVYVGLLADDDSGGQAIHDSGVYQIHHQMAGAADWNIAPGDVTVVGITEEGVNVLLYKSMDRFANMEFVKSLTIKIDKTPPVVTIHSPEPDGFYLTSGSLTIDFEATDEPSGVYSIVADMDGDPVTDGQVFSDLTTMAGYHTVTVTAEDYAGNTTTESVTFSIKIHANVEISPQPLNTKSTAISMGADIGFPPEYDVNDIDISTVYLGCGSHTFPAKLSPCNIGGFGPDGLPVMQSQYARRDVCGVLVGVTDFVEMTVQGELFNITQFWGADTVDVFTPNDHNPKAAPARLAIRGVDPNPLGDYAVIKFALPREGQVELDLYDVSGRFVAGIAAGDYPAGYHTVRWDTDARVANGIYLLRLKLDEETITAKTVVWR